MHAVPPAAAAPWTTPSREIAALMRDQPVSTLPRVLRLFPTTNIVVADMIGAGIFTTSGLLMAGLYNPLLMLLLWLVGGVLALCGALCYGELGAAMPEAGGEYVYLTRLYHPLLGFLTGWVSIMAGFSAPIAAASLGCSEYLASAFPALFAWGHPILLKRILALAVIIIFTAIHYRGISFGAAVQNWLTALKVLLIVALITAGFAVGRGDLGHLFEGRSFTLDFSGFKTIGLSLMWIMFAYSGWSASSYLGAEIRDPVRNLPRSLLFGTGLVTLLYFLLNLLFVYAAPPEEMSGVIAIGGLTAGRLFGDSVQSLISLLIAFALLSAISAFIILGPRIYFAMARDGCFFRMAGEIHPTFRSPHKSIVLQSLIAALMILTGTFDQILTYMGFSLGIFPLFAVFGVFRLRRYSISVAPMPLYPLAPLVFLTAGIGILVFAYLERPVESTIALLMVTAGIPAWFAFTRSAARAAARERVATERRSETPE
jgi:APA family basic amino acid/polyamine antiporter